MALLTKEAQQKIEQRIITRLLNEELPVVLSKEITKVLSEKIDLDTIINEVRSAIPTPQDGKDAEITDDMISGMVMKVLDRMSEIHKVKDGKDGRDGKDGQDYVITEADYREILSKIRIPQDGKDAQISEELLSSMISKVAALVPRARDGKDGNNYALTNADISEIASRIRVPKDGKDGDPYALTEQDIDLIVSKIPKPLDGTNAKEIDVSEVISQIDFTGFSTVKSTEEIIKKLKNDIGLGKIELPDRGVGGGGMTDTEIRNAINRVLGQEDWQNGLPGDGTIGGNLDWLNLNESPTEVPSGAGVLSWNMDEICLDVQSGIGPTLQVGQETYILLYNDLAGPITNGTVLRPKSAVVVDDLVIPTVEKTNASVFSTVEGTIMMATMNIPVGEIGLATRFGRVRGINTDGLTPGVNVYVGTTDGEYTTTAPAFPNYAISIGGIIKADATDGEIFVSVTRDFSDTVLNFWNGTFRETINFTVSSAVGVVTGSLSPDNGHPDMTMMFSDGFSMLTTTPPATIVLTPGTADIPQQNFVYIPKSTKVLTVSTSDWPATEHIKVANVLLRTAALTLSDGALVNRNWNDHIENTTTFQGHLPHITEKLRQFEAQWNSGAQGSASGFPSNFYVAVTAGVIYQLHQQPFPDQSMPTDDIHVVNHPATPYLTVNNLNGQTLDSLGVTLANSSFSFVVWGVQNRTGQASHLMCNLPTGNYSKNTPANAVSDALNYSVYNIPSEFKGTGFLIARFTLILEADGTTWSLHDTEDLRGKIPNTTAGGGAGGTGVTTLNGLSDYPAAHVAGQIPRVNAAGTGQDFTSPGGLSGLKTGTLASPPANLLIDELWEDTTDSSDHPTIRQAKVTT